MFWHLDEQNDPTLLIKWFSCLRHKWTQSREKTWACVFPWPSFSNSSGLNEEHMRGKQSSVRTVDTFYPFFDVRSMVFHSHYPLPTSALFSYFSLQVKVLFSHAFFLLLCSVFVSLFWRGDFCNETLMDISLFFILTLSLFLLLFHGLLILDFFKVTLVWVNTHQAYKSCM